LITDIDKGGAFAHLYGTWALLSVEDRNRIHGFVLNKFRGDVSLLTPAPEMLEKMTGVPTLAVLPMWWQHGLPEEDGVFDDRSRATGLITRTVAVIAYPRISNLDEFQPLKNVSGLRLVWARSPSDLAALGKEDWIILPGSKNTSSDLSWLRSQKLDQCICDHANNGNFVLGICGGLQILGEALIDSHGVDGNAAGLGLLSLVTTFEANKTVKRTLAKLGQVRGALSPLSGIELSGYEIHHGQTTSHRDMLANGKYIHEIAVNLAWQNDLGNVTGIYMHGLFENQDVLKALFGSQTITLDSVFDGLAEFLSRHMSPITLQKLIA
jgi:adenosylcobyric acid synthase